MLIIEKVYSCHCMYACKTLIYFFKMYPHPDKKREHHVIDTYLSKMNQKKFNMHQKMTFL